MIRKTIKRCLKTLDKINIPKEDTKHYLYLREVFKQELERSNNLSKALIKAKRKTSHNLSNRKSK